MSQPEGTALPARCGSQRPTALIPSWHVAQTHPQAEDWAARELGRQGFLCFLPSLTVLRRDMVTRTITRPVQRPLWPGYLLIRFALADPWGPIQHTRGVARLLMADAGCPGMVPDGLVEALQATEASRRSLTPPAAPWRPGAPCKLAGGAFEGHDGVVISLGRQTASVALVVFGAVREVIVSLAIIARRGV